MGQITFRIPDREQIFLEYVSKRTGSSMSSIYRDKTLHEFKKWKLKFLLDEYVTGVIGFKRLCQLGSISLTEGMLLLESHNIEPSIPAIVDDYTFNVAKEISSKEMYKSGKKPIRKTPTVKFTKEENR